jgi:hypothetical protein
VLAGAFAVELVGYILLTISLIKMMGASGNPGDTFEIFLKIGNLVYAGAAITLIVGYVFCMLGPNKRGSMPMAISTLAVAGVGLLLTLIFKLPFLFGSVGFGGFGGRGIAVSGFGLWFPQLLTQIAFSAEMILLPLYLRALALALKENAMVRQSMLVMFLGCGYAGARVLTYIFWYIAMNSFISAMINFTGRGGGPPKAMIWITIVFLWVGAIVFAAQLTFLTLLSWKMRNAVDRR